MLRDVNRSDVMSLDSSGSIGVKVSVFVRWKDAGSWVFFVYRRAAFGLLVDALEACSHGIIWGVVSTERLDRFEPRHPIIFSVL